VAPRFKYHGKCENYVARDNNGGVATALLDVLLSQRTVTKNVTRGGQAHTQAHTTCGWTMSDRRVKETCIQSYLPLCHLSGHLSPMRHVPLFLRIPRKNSISLTRSDTSKAEKDNHTNSISSPHSLSHPLQFASRPHSPPPVITTAAVANEAARLAVAPRQVPQARERIRADPRNKYG